MAEAAEVMAEAVQLFRGQCRHSRSEIGLLGMLGKFGRCGYLRQGSRNCHHTVPHMWQWGKRMVGVARVVMGEDDGRGACAGGAGGAGAGGADGAGGGDARCGRAKVGAVLELITHRRLVTSGWCLRDPQQAVHRPFH